MPAPDHAASTSAASSLSKEDHACQVWLHGKRPNSVVFTLLCWPFGADQQTYSRMPCTEWRVSVELSEDPGQEEVEAAIR